MKYVNEKYLEYLNDPVCAKLARVLETLDRHADQWMTHDSTLESSWIYVKKKILVQFVDGLFPEEIEEEERINATTKRGSEYE